MVGEERDTYFWEDHCLGESPLCVLFRRLYHLSSLKNDFVADFLVWFGSYCSFSFGFHRSLSDRETIEVVVHLSLPEGHPFRLGRRDVRFWSPNPFRRVLG